MQDLAGTAVVASLLFTSATGGEVLLTTTDGSGTTQELGTFTIN